MASAAALAVTLLDVTLLRDATASFAVLPSRMVLALFLPTFGSASVCLVSLLLCLVAFYLVVGLLARAGLPVCCWFNAFAFCWAFALSLACAIDASEMRRRLIITSIVTRGIPVGARLGSLVKACNCCLAKSLAVFSAITGVSSSMSWKDTGALWRLISSSTAWMRGKFLRLDGVVGLCPDRAASIATIA